MSKLTISGRATRNVEADTEHITLRFQNHAENAAEASKETLAECESFLQELTQWGVSMDQIHMSKDEISQEYDDGELEVTVTREISIELPYNMAFNNSIMELIQEKEMNIDYEIGYSLSAYETVHKELMQEALADSKEKAELIASSVGQKIIGIDTFKLSDRYSRVQFELMMQPRMGSRPERAATLSDQLKAPTTEETESVEVVWLMSE